MWSFSTQPQSSYVGGRDRYLSMRLLLPLGPLPNMWSKDDRSDARFGRESVWGCRNHLCSTEGDDGGSEFVRSDKSAGVSQRVADVFRAYFRHVGMMAIVKACD